MPEHSGKNFLITFILIIISGIIVFFITFLTTGILGLKSRKADADQLAQMTIIPAPTLTPIIAALEVQPTMVVRYVSTEGFTTGAYVKIVNTQGSGLKIRPEPGTAGIPLFIAMDGELYMIMDGPQDQDGYIWWKLRSVEDETKEGWGAANYFELAAPAYDQAAQPTDQQ